MRLLDPCPGDRLPGPGCPLCDHPTAPSSQVGVGTQAQDAGSQRTTCSEHNSGYWQVGMAWFRGGPHALPRASPLGLVFRHFTNIRFIF